MVDNASNAGAITTDLSTNAQESTSPPASSRDPFTVEVVEVEVRKRRGSALHLCCVWDGAGV